MKTKNNNYQKRNELFACLFILLYLTLNFFNILSPNSMVNISKHLFKKTTECTIEQVQKSASIFTILFLYHFFLTVCY